MKKCVMGAAEMRNARNALKIKLNKRNGNEYAYRPFPF
jgi:hypothetical protein